MGAQVCQGAPLGTDGRGSGESPGQGEDGKQPAQKSRFHPLHHCHHSMPQVATSPHRGGGSGGGLRRTLPLRRAKVAAGGGRSSLSRGFIALSLYRFHISHFPIFVVVTGRGRALPFVTRRQFPSALSSTAKPVSHGQRHGGGVGRGGLRQRGRTREKPAFNPPLGGRPRCSPLSSSSAPSSALPLPAFQISIYSDTEYSDADVQRINKAVDLAGRPLLSSYGLVNPSADP